VGVKGTELVVMDKRQGSTDSPAAAAAAAAACVTDSEIEGKGQLISKVAGTSIFSEETEVLAVSGGTGKCMAPNPN